MMALDCAFLIRVVEGRGYRVSSSISQSGRKHWVEALDTISYHFLCLDYFLSTFPTILLGIFMAVWRQVSQSARFEVSLSIYLIDQD
jgi:hypothetical protein